MHNLVCLLLAGVVACSEPAAPVPAPAPSVPPPLPWRVLVERTRTSFSLVGEVGQAALDPDQRQLIEGDERLSRVRLDVTRDPKTTAKDSHLLEDVIKVALALDTATIDVHDGTIDVRGQVLGDEEKAELIASIQQSAELRRGFTTKVELEVVAPPPRPGEGFIHRVDRRPFAGTRLIDVVDGSEVVVDRYDRVKAGIYTLAGSPIRYAVADQGTTWVRDSPATIVVAGMPYALDTDLTVHHPEDPGALTFQRYGGPTVGGSKDGMPTAGYRYVEPGEKLDGKDIATLRQFMHAIILHCDLTADSKAGYEALLDRSLSGHFLIDWDGTIHEVLDPLFAVYHAGELDRHSISIDLDNLLPNLEREPNAPMYAAKHPELARMLVAARVGRRARALSQRSTRTVAGATNVRLGEVRHMVKLLSLMLVVMSAGVVRADTPATPPLDLSYVVTRAEHSKDSHTNVESWVLKRDSLTYTSVTSHRHGGKDPEPLTVTLTAEQKAKLIELLGAPELAKDLAVAHPGTPGPGVDTEIALSYRTGAKLANVKASGATSRFGSDVVLPFESSKTVVALRALESYLQTLTN